MVLQDLISHFTSNLHRLETKDRNMSDYLYVPPKSTDRTPDYLYEPDLFSGDPLEHLRQENTQLRVMLAELLIKNQTLRWEVEAQRRAASALLAEKPKSNCA